MTTKSSITPNHFLRYLKKSVINHLKENNSSKSVEIERQNEIGSSNDAKSIIVSIVRANEYLQVSTSISSRIALSIPKLKHFFFSYYNLSSDFFIKFPANLTACKLRKEVNNEFFEKLDTYKVKAIILVDPDEWPELFFECKKRGVYVFWINAVSKKKYVPLTKMLSFAHYFSKKTKDRHSNVFTFAKDLESRELIQTRNLGYKINQTVGSVKPEPVTLSTKGRSKVHKTFFDTNCVVWFAAGVYEEEIIPILKCQIELTESIPNIHLLLLLKNQSLNEIKVEKSLREKGFKDFRLVNYNIFFVDWDKEEIIDSLYNSRVTLLGGSLYTDRYEYEVFDPILPISYSSSVVVGKNFGHHKELICDLIKCGGIKSVKENKKCCDIYSKELSQVIFDSLKSNTLANRISNAWSMTTRSTGFTDEIIKTLKGTLDE